MPLVRVELFERRLTPELESKLIERMTETLLEVLEAPGAEGAHVGDRRGPRRPPLGSQRETLGRRRKLRCRFVEVKLYDKRVTEESVPKIIEAMTEALAESSGAAREHIQVVVHGVSPKHWGIAGKAQG